MGQWVWVLSPNWNPPREQKKKKKKGGKFIWLREKWYAKNILNRYKKEK